MNKTWAVILLLTCMSINAFAQETNEKEALDSVYIHHVEEKGTPYKVLHAEPLYIDLIRDLGARKGEQEWNIGMGITDNTRFDSYETLIEYEFAPIDRLGLEIELPFTFYSKVNGTKKDEIPEHRMESLKLAAQYTFLVSERYSTSMALGYINEFVFSDFRKMGRQVFHGNVFNPFFIAAKRWGNNFHTLIYTGPHFEKEFGTPHWHNRYDINTNIHYMIPGTRNFIGVEINKDIYKNDFDMVIRPQLRVSIADNLLVGILAGIPVNRETQRFSTFVRIIWEPGSKH